MPNLPHVQQLAQALLATPLSDIIPDPRNRGSLLMEPGLEYISEPAPETFSPNSRPVHRVPISPDQATLREALSIMAHKYLGDPFVREESRRKAKANAAYQAYVNAHPPLQKYLALFDALAALADEGTPPDNAATSEGIAVLETQAREAEATHRAFREQMLAKARLEEDHYAQKTYDMLDQLAQAEEKPAALPQALFDRIKRGGDETLPDELDQWLRQHRPMTEEDYAARRAVNSRFVDTCDSHEAEVLRYVADKVKTIAI